MARGGRWSRAPEDTPVVHSGEPHANGRSDLHPLAVVADDEVEMRKLVGEILGEAGFKTLPARDGAELLELAARHRPKLIVVDVMMPTMDGYTAVARLRGEPATADIPVIMITGWTDPTYSRLSEGMGVAAHVTKPFSPMELAELAQRMVRESGA
jgi:CheY-like chemotaxis protein